jgi:hypothetical protein
MQLTKLLTLAFERNVGAIDRIARFAIGAALAFLPWITPIPKGLDYAVIVVGAMVAVSGLLARCSIYYFLGYSTCPISGKAKPS